MIGMDHIRSITRPKNGSLLRYRNHTSVEDGPESPNNATLTPANTLAAILRDSEEPPNLRSQRATGSDSHDA